MAKEQNLFYVPNLSNCCDVDDLVWCIAVINHPQFPGFLSKKKKPQSLVNLCIGVLGRHLEDIFEDLKEIAIGLPGDIKLAVAAIARRRKLLSDDVLIALADASWEILDVSGSDVSDFGLIKAAEVCRFIKALDISRCTKITAIGISELVKHCHSLGTLGCGGCPRSDNNNVNLKVVPAESSNIGTKHKSEKASTSKDIKNSAVGNIPFPCVNNISKGCNRLSYYGNHHLGNLTLVSADKSSSSICLSKQSSSIVYPPPPNQWLVSIMSPSEGLVYKPIIGPCPPNAGGIMTLLYGACGALSLNPGTKDVLEFSSKDWNAFWFIITTTVTTIQSWKI
ncbi:hypothetical protein KIW84_052047 [Lathyrus oleraceus]|uniref:RNI-like superfamily protein n=1 Tax=Pisum sativum TaxID=3888 RepID=A0A9D4WNV2_PEA|nr:hypothetical protein KIW84_052047 [Pisum sativum]